MLAIYARAMPAKAAKIDNRMLEEVDEPLLAEVVAGAPVPEVVPLPEGAVALGLGLPDAAEAGGPKKVSPEGMGPGAADAEAPTPINPPKPWPGVAVVAMAAAWKAAKVLPVAGALMDPTIPALQ